MARGILLLLALLALSAPALAQTPELSGSWGWMWGGNATSFRGRLSLDSRQSFSGVVSVPAGHLNWGEFHYTWQGTQLMLEDLRLERALTSIDIQYFQLVGARALQDGPLQPFLIGGVGTTYYRPSESFTEIGGERYDLGSSWRLNFVLGGGLKYWLGREERIGLRLQFRLLPTIYNGSTGIWVGGGGSSISVSGDAVWQFDASAGIAVKLGG